MCFWIIEPLRFSTWSSCGFIHRAWLCSWALAHEIYDFPNLNHHWISWISCAWLLWILELRLVVGLSFALYHPRDFRFIDPQRVKSGMFPVFGYLPHEPSYLWCSSRNLYASIITTDPSSWNCLCGVNLVKRGKTYFCYLLAKSTYLSLKSPCSTSFAGIYPYFCWFLLCQVPSDSHTAIVKLPLRQKHALL